MHKKKCDICGFLFDESDDLSYLVLNGPGQCPYCKEIIELRDIISNYDNKHSDKTWADKIHDRNMIPDRSSFKTSASSIIQTYSLAENERTYEIINRSKLITKTIIEIERAREILVTKLGPQFAILDSIYEDKNPFWNETGHLLNFVHDASLQYIIIKLKELISGSKSECSINKIKNIFINNKKQFFKDQQIYEVFKFKKSGDIAKIKFDGFPIIEYVNKLSKVLDSYEKTINAISDLRDNEYAHIGKVKSLESYKINYCSIKRIFNSIKIVYDGFLYSIAPDKFANLYLNYDMRFSHLKEMTSVWHKNLEDRRKKVLEDIKKN